MFFVAAVISNALDDDLGVVATGEGAFRVGPIAFGLAFVVTGHRSLPLLVLAKMTGCFGRVFVNHEIAERVAHTPCSGLVQYIFSSPARLAYVFSLLTPIVAAPPS